MIPPKVAITKETAPRKNINTDLTVRKVVACMEAPTGVNARIGYLAAGDHLSATVFNSDIQDSNIQDFNCRFLNGYLVTGYWLLKTP
jgi:hypothetical protein